MIWVRLFIRECFLVFCLWFLVGSININNKIKIEMSCLRLKYLRLKCPEIKTWWRLNFSRLVTNNGCLFAKFSEKCAFELLHQILYLKRNSLLMYNCNFIAWGQIKVNSIQFICPLYPKMFLNPYPRGSCKKTSVHQGESAVFLNLS